MKPNQFHGKEKVSILTKPAVFLSSKDVTCWSNIHHKWQKFWVKKMLRGKFATFVSPATIYFFSQLATFSSRSFFFVL